MGKEESADAVTGLVLESKRERDFLLERKSNSAGTHAVDSALSRMLRNSRSEGEDARNLREKWKPHLQDAIKVTRVRII
ncbi:hypothetical protein MDAP_002095 [Mitosporidium daphniae]